MCDGDYRHLRNSNEYLKHIWCFLEIVNTSTASPEKTIVTSILRIVQVTRSIHGSIFNCRLDMTNTLSGYVRSVERSIKLNVDCKINDVSRMPIKDKCRHFFPKIRRCLARSAYPFIHILPREKVKTSRYDALPRPLLLAHTNGFMKVIFLI